MNDDRISNLFISRIQQQQHNDKFLYGLLEYLCGANIKIHKGAISRILNGMRSDMRHFFLPFIRCICFSHEAYDNLLGGTNIHLNGIKKISHIQILHP